MKSATSRFFETPHTQLGWWSVGLTLLFTGLFVSVATDFIHFPGILTIGLGMLAGMAYGIPGLFAILFAISEIPVSHSQNDSEV